MSMQIHSAAVGLALALSWLTWDWQASVAFAFVPVDQKKVGSKDWLRPTQQSFDYNSNLWLVPLGIDAPTNNDNTKKNIIVKEKATTLPCLDDQGRFFDRTTGHYFQFGWAEPSDLSNIARLIVQGFGADAIRLSQGDWNDVERLLMKPAVELINGYSGLVAFAEVLVGLQQRLHRPNGSNFVAPPPVDQCTTLAQQVELASRSSIVLIVTPQPSTDDDDDGIVSSDWHKNVIATVELRLQPCDAKIPFTLPLLDQLERRLADLIVGSGEKKNDRMGDLQPYLSNLCVDEAYRGRGIARLLVRCVEDIARHDWGYERLYLHVDRDNTAALELYKSAGYCDVELRWNPFWAGKAAEISYFVKHLSSRNEKSSAEVVKAKVK